MLGLDSKVNLLIYVASDANLMDSIQKNYEVFYEILCQKKVPIVLFITSLEDGNDWNETTFRTNQLRFSRIACIRAHEGDHNQVAKEESRMKVERLIYGYCSEKPWIPPARKDDISWLSTLVLNNCDKLAEVFDFQPRAIASLVYEALMSSKMDKDRKSVV